MQAAISSAMADDLMAIQAHLTTHPKHIPGNLITAVSWHAIGELYHVSRSPLELLDSLLIPLSSGMFCAGSVSTPLGSCQITSAISCGPFKIWGHGSLLAGSLNKWWWSPLRLF